MNDSVIRKDYLKTLMRFKDRTDLIKIITGMRRCGKSTLLRQFMDCLIEDGIDPERIIYINLDSRKNIELLDDNRLYEYLISMTSEKRTYFLLDEIQNVIGWEKVVNSMLLDADVDIYLTGSNSYMLSTELSTFLTGRNVTINMLPLSFKEFKELRGSEDNGVAFKEYLTIGSMPMLRNDMSEGESFQIVDAVRSDIMIKDIYNRNKKIDSQMMGRTIEYLFSEIGNQISPNSISKELNIDHKTIDGYLKMVTDSLLFYQVKRYDLKGKMLLKTPSKYYCTDLGMRNAFTGDLKDIGRSVENIAFLELLRRGYNVRTGKTDDSEIDFIAIKSGRKEYYQVSFSIVDKDTEKREMRPLERMNDGNRRIILTMDTFGLGTFNGIERINFIDWLLSDHE